MYICFCGAGNQPRHENEVIKMDQCFVYIPYGDEWKKQMMKLKKETIISMLANVGRERDELEKTLKEYKKKGV